MAVAQYIVGTIAVIPSDLLFHKRLGSVTSSSELSSRVCFAVSWPSLAVAAGQGHSQFRAAVQASDETIAAGLDMNTADHAA